MNEEKLALFEALKSTFLHIDAHEKAMLDQFGLSLPRFYVLLHVHNNPGINQVELTQLMLCTKGNVTRILQGMEQEGLISRKGDPNDGRITLVHLTRMGDVLLKNVYKAYEVLVEDLMGKFSDEEIKVFNKDLEIVQNTLDPKPQTEPRTNRGLVLVLEDQGEEK